MAYKDYNQYKAIKYKQEQSFRKLLPDIKNISGLYFYTRVENGFKFCYVGKSIKLLDRIISHDMGYEQHIDLSLKKHKYWSEENTTGWKIAYKYFPESELDEREREYILKAHRNGYQLLNVEIGGTVGKTDIGERKKPKSYREGIKQGEKNAQKFVANLFEKHLDYITKKEPPTKHQENAMKKFEEFLKTEE